jgi:hypothetical protein
MQAALRRVATPKLYRQTVRHGGGGGHARPRSSAFFPQYVNYLNSEDQVCLIFSFLSWLIVGLGNDRCCLRMGITYTLS